MWLTLPPMKNYWHEPTCQQYNHEWCAEEKGHSWGPRHYVEEQLSSLAPWLRYNSVLKTRCLTHSHIYLCGAFSFFFFFLPYWTMWFMAAVATCHHVKINMWFQHRGVTNFIPSPFRLEDCTLLWNWMTDHPAFNCRGTAGEGLHHECGATCLSVSLSLRLSFYMSFLPCFVRAQPLRFYLVLSTTDNTTEVLFEDRLGLNGRPMILIISRLATCIYRRRTLTLSLC